MIRLHIIGRKNHGKTLLVTEVVSELARRGLRVGTIKHTHHHHELDLPGKDSHRHRLAGAAVAGILSPSLDAVFVPVTKGAMTDEQRYAALATHYTNCDLVIVEGDSQTTAPKIEVWRAERGTPPMAGEDPAILAVVTNDPCEAAGEILPRSDVPRLADWILARLRSR